MYAGIMLIWNVHHNVGLGRAEVIGNKQTVRVATQYAPAPLLARWRPSASRAAEQTQRSSSFPRLMRSHGHRCPASRVKATLSKAAW